MKYLAYFCLILSINLFFASCSSSSEQEKPAPSAEISASQKKLLAAWEELSINGQKILGSYQGIVRNKTWGISINSIKEPFEKSENQPNNGISFTQYLDDTDLNFVDISYLGEADNLKQIKLDIFLEDVEEVRSLKAEMQAFFAVKFGKETNMGKVKTWEQNKTRIVLEDVSTSKDPGLQITFTQLP